MSLNLLIENLQKQRTRLGKLMGRLQGNDRDEIRRVCAELDRVLDGLKATNLERTQHECPVHPVPRSEVDQAPR